MKSYYQYQNGFRLPKSIYQKTVKTIQAYHYYKGIYNSLNHCSDPKNPSKKATDKVTAENYIRVIEESLKEYVQEEYQEPVFLHLTDQIDYLTLEYQYGVSISTMKRWVQRFVYGVATNIGDNFKQ